MLEGECMVTEKKNDTLCVVLVLLALSLILGGSLLAKFEMIDMLYLVFIICCAIRLVYIKKKS